MQTVVDDAGDRYLLVKRSTESWLVRDPETGVHRHLPAAELSVVGDVPPLETAARAVPESARTAIPLRSERALGLLAEIHARGPVGVRTLLDAYTLCESDLHGILADLTAAELVAEAEIPGERAYEATSRVAGLLDADE